MAHSPITSNPNSRPEYFRNLFEECLFVFTVMMATASTTILQGVVLINTATITEDLVMTPAQAAWISASIGYCSRPQFHFDLHRLISCSLTSGSFTLCFGKTADLLGRKLQLVSGLAFLSVTSLATAFVPSPLGLNVLCGFLGLGTAVISPPAIGTLFDTYPEGRRRSRATGALGCGNPIGFILGSVSSGIVTRYYSWRASFIVIAIFFAIMTAASFWTMPPSLRAGSLRLEVRQFDYVGTVLTIVGLGLISAALTSVPLLYLLSTLTNFQRSPGARLAISPSCCDVLVWFHLTSRLRNLGELLSISTSESGGLEK
jgi:MFS family permease